MLDSLAAIDSTLRFDDPVDECHRNRGITFVKRLQTSVVAARCDGSIGGVKHEAVFDGELVGRLADEMLADVDDSHILVRRRLLGAHLSDRHVRTKRPARRTVECRVCHRGSDVVVGRGQWVGRCDVSKLAHRPEVANGIAKKRSRDVGLREDERVRRVVSARKNTVSSHHPGPLVGDDSHRRCRIPRLDDRPVGVPVDIRREFLQRGDQLEIDRHPAVAGLRQRRPKVGELAGRERRHHLILGPVDRSSDPLANRRPRVDEFDGWVAGLGTPIELIEFVAQLVESLTERPQCLLGRPCSQPGRRRRLVEGDESPFHQLAGEFVDVPLRDVGSLCNLARGRLPRPEDDEIGVGLLLREAERHEMIAERLFGHGRELCYYLQNTFPPVCSGGCMETVSEAETRRHVDSRRWWTLTIFAFIALEGAALQMQGAIIPVLRETFSTPQWQLGLVAPAGTVGFLVFAAAVGVIAGRFDTRRLLLFGIVGTGLSVFLMGAVPTFGVFLVALVVRGSFAGIARGSDRPLLSHLYPHRRGRLFGYYDMMWAVGATLGPLAVTAALWAGNWRLAYYALGISFLPVIALVWYLPKPSVDGGDKPLTLAGVRRIARNPAVVVMATGILFSSGIEGGLFTWLTTYADGRLPASLATASLSVLLVAYIPGRFVAGRLSERFGYVPLAAGLGTLSLLSAVYTFVFASGNGLLVGVFGTGLGLSGLYPTFLAYATESTPEHSAPINALALVISSCGIAGVPTVMGFVIGGAGVDAAMRLLFIPLVGLLIVTVLAWVRLPSPSLSSQR